MTPRLIEPTVVAGRGNRVLIALCGLAGVVMLTAHFLIPGHVPGDGSAPGTVVQFIHEHHAAILATAWLQAVGPFPYVLFALAVAHLAGGMTRLAGWIILLAAAVLLTLSLIDAAFTIFAVEAVANGHPATAAVSFDLIDGPHNDAIGRTFLLAPPLLLPVGSLLLRSPLLPRPFGYLAIAIGAGSIGLGLAALFSIAAFAAAIGLIIADNLWVLGAAAVLIARPGPAVSARAVIAVPVTAAR